MTNEINTNSARNTTSARRATGLFSRNIFHDFALNPEWDVESNYWDHRELPDICLTDLHLTTTKDDVATYLRGGRV